MGAIGEIREVLGARQVEIWDPTSETYSWCVGYWLNLPIRQLQPQRQSIRPIQYTVGFKSRQRGRHWNRVQEK